MEEHLTWKEHITVIENKVKKFRLSVQSQKVLDTTALKKLYFFFIHSYLNYGNIVCVSRSRAKLKRTSE